MTRRRTSEPGDKLLHPAAGTASDRDPGDVEPRQQREVRHEGTREDPEQEWREYIDSLKRDGLVDNDILFRAQVIVGRKGEIAAMDTIHSFFPVRHTKDPVRKSLLQYRNAAADLRDNIDRQFPQKRPAYDLRPEMAHTLATQLLKQNAAEDITITIARRLWQGPPPDLHLERFATSEPKPLSQEEYERRMRSLDKNLLPLTEKRHNNHIDSPWKHERPSLEKEVKEIREVVMTLLQEGLPFSNVRNPNGKLKMSPTFARRDFLTMIRAIAGTETGSSLLLHGARPTDVDRFARMVDPSLISVDGMYFSEGSDPRQRAIRKQDIRGIEPLLGKLRAMDASQVQWQAKLRADEETAATRQQQEVVRSFAANMRTLAEASVEEDHVRRSMVDTGWRGAVLKLLSAFGMYPRMSAARDAKKEALRALNAPEYKDLRGDAATLEDRAHDLLLLADSRLLTSLPASAGEASADATTAPRPHSAAPRPRQEQ